MGLVNIEQFVAGPPILMSFVMDHNFEVYNLGLSGNWNKETTRGQIFENSPWGLAASALSLATNALATGLVLYKAW